jgi:multidrug transporter EmrE-like cation transporter
MYGMAGGEVKDSDDVETSAIATLWIAAACRRFAKAGADWNNTIAFALWRGSGTRHSILTAHFT